MVREMHRNVLEKDSWDTTEAREWGKPKKGSGGSQMIDKCNSQRKKRELCNGGKNHLKKKSWKVSQMKKQKRAPTPFHKTVSFQGGKDNPEGEGFVTRVRNIGGPDMCRGLSPASKGNVHGGRLPRGGNSRARRGVGSKRGRHAALSMSTQ